MDEIIEDKLYYGKYFNLSYFLCLFCGDVLRDPVTLRCGHSYSKKCAMIKADSNDGVFTCYRCEQCPYSISYLSSLKINIVMLSVIEKFWNNTGDETCKTFKVGCLNLNKKSPADCGCDLCRLDEDKAGKSENFVAICQFIDQPFPNDCLKKGCKLVNFERLQEAIRHFFICSVFNPESILIKNRLYEIQALHRYLSTCPKSLKNSAGVLTLPDSLELKGDNNIQETSSEHCKEPIVKHNMCKLMNKLCEDLDLMTGVNFVRDRFSVLNLDKKEFDCVLCARILLEPFTTTCGHTFCRTCYNRCLDYQTDCPLCKSTLVTRYSERILKIDEFIELVIKTKYFDDYNERKNSYLLEMHHLLNAGNSPEDELPLFVCTISFPTVPCPLHIFEPRYRHMIRQCVESGGNKFGMCAHIENNVARYGTFLEIKKVDYLEDGRSIVKTVGGNRFRILRKGECDGYQTAFVEQVTDDAICIDSMPDIQQFHDHLYNISKDWFYRLPIQTLNRILHHFGSMPRMEPKDLNNSNGPAWMWWMLAILPVEQKSLVAILSMTSVFRRLQALQKIILHLDPTVYSLMQ